MDVVGRVESVNVGLPREHDWHGRVVTTAIWKTPVTGPVAASGVNLVGDGQADRRVHGGPDKAVYAYALEDYAWWRRELASDVGAATFGENLTTSGVDFDDALVGERWQVGTVTLEVRQPRLPCFKLGLRMGEAAFVDRFEGAGRYGAYLRIVEEGVLQGGDVIRRVSRPAHDLTIADLGRAHRDRNPELLAQVSASVEVPEGWRTWARKTQDRLAG